MRRNRNQPNTFLSILLRTVPLFILAAVVAVAAYNREKLTVESIVAFTPDNLWLAMLVLWGIYALKSLSIFLPIVVLFIAGGLLFPPLPAIVVNIVGMLIAVTLPFWVGHLAGGVAVGKLIRRFPKAALLRELQNENEIFFSFLSRAVSCLPSDLVSIYLGASGMRYGRYVLGAALGYLPLLISATLLGTSITDISSPLFYVSAGAVALIVTVSVILFHRHRSKPN